MRMAVFACIFLFLSIFAFSEDKFSTEIVPKLADAEKLDAPELAGNIYPPWGTPCMNFTYWAVYKDKEGREPEYVRINLNGQWHDMKKINGDYKNGATYEYNIIPDSGKQLFYYFEASNGKGKARSGIIDSPNQGPLLFSEKLDNNEIVMLDKDGKLLWNYSTGRDSVEGIALSKDGNYAAAATGYYIYLFSRESGIPVWKFCKTCELPPVINSLMAGVAISGDGRYIAGTMNGRLYFFERESNEPLWSADIESGAIGADMSDDGNYTAVGIANAGEHGDRFFLFDKEGNELVNYKAEHPDYVQTGNFYGPDMTPDGSYTAVSTGCPDRRAYLFSKEGLVFRSEQLTGDSPVHKSAISDNGNLIAYSADHVQGKEIVFLFNRAGKKLWGFSSADDGTARAISISGDGNYIGAGTTGGHVYLFSKGSSTPIWKFAENGFFSQFGDVKLNADGSRMAAVGTSKKVYMFSRESNVPLWEYEANTWVTKVDFNGEYAIAGTGPREYFMEGRSVPETQVECSEIIQPPERDETQGMVLGENGAGKEFSGTAVCGDGICITPPESFEGCPQDCCPPTGCEDELYVEDCPQGECADEGDKLAVVMGRNATGADGSGKALTRKSYCGNGICEEPSESPRVCPKDCAWEDGQGNKEAECVSNCSKTEEKKETSEGENSGIAQSPKGNGNAQGNTRASSEKGFFEIIMEFIKNLLGI